QGIAGLDDIFKHSGLSGFHVEDKNTYRPLSLASLAVEYQFFGLKSGAYHVTNTLFYGLACLLLFEFLILLFPGVSLTIPIIISFLFASHSVHTGVVASIKSRDEIFVALFGLAALILVLKSYAKNSWWFLAGSLVCFFLSLLSKENALTLLAIFP